MADNGDRFRDAIVREIESWHAPIDIKIEQKVGYRFVNTPRKLDIVCRHEDKYLGIECKIQETQGTTYQKLSYAIDDCLTAPIKTIIAFGGRGIKDDMKAKLVASGIGLELSFLEGATPNLDTVADSHKLFRQRVYIELGLDWFPFMV